MSPCGDGLHLGRAKSMVEALRTKANQTPPFLGGW